MSIHTHIILENISKSYSEGAKNRNVLSNLNLELNEGELAVLLGRSGSGKSTLLNIISGIDTPDTGKVLISGTDLATLTEKERTLFRRNNIGFVFQSFNLISTLTALENVLLPLHLKGMKEEESHEKANHFLAEVGLSERADSYPDRLSGGEQQRIAIARALAHQPMLILADEPTGNLDYETDRQILDMLNMLVREHRRTILLATHDRDICAMADRVFELQKGKLWEISELTTA